MPVPLILAATAAIAGATGASAVSKIAGTLVHPVFTGALGALYGFASTQKTSDSNSFQNNELILAEFILSNTPENFNDLSFSISDASKMLGINAETIRRKVRSGAASVVNENEVGGRTGYQISAKTMMDLCKEFSKQKELATALVFYSSDYRMYYGNLLLKFSDTTDNLSADYKDLLRTLSKSLLEEQTSKREDLDNVIIVPPSTNSSDNTKGMEKQLLNTKIKAAELELEIVKQKTDSAETSESKLELLQKQIELQQTLLELNNQLLKLQEAEK